MSLLQVSGISRQEEGTWQLKDISFTQKEFQKIAIAGATGSGKTTLLKIIAGLAHPDEGEVFFEGTRVLSPYERLIPGHPRIAYMSQHFELQNYHRVEGILEIANLLPDEEAAMIYSICRIDHLLKRWTSQLSGGERQRIVLARLLVTAPRLLVLDEPYSNLDAIHTHLLKTVIHDIGERMKITCLLVSHDPVDVLPWADEIIVLQEGRIVQKGSPIEVYKEPVNEHAAALFGKYTIIPPELAGAFSAFTNKKKNGNGIFIRPSDFKIVPDKNKGLKGEVRASRFMGSYYETEISIAGNNIIVDHNNGHLKKGDIAYVTL